MNKKGDITTIYGLMIAIVLIVLGLALAPTLKSFTDDARNVTDGDRIGLDCENSSISNFDKATCITTDSTNFLWFGFILFLGGAIIVAKILW